VEYDVVVASVRDAPILNRLLDSLAACDPLPDQVTIVNNRVQRSDFSQALPLRVLGLESDFYPVGFNDAALRRNVGIWASTAERIIFLDDDLIVPLTFMADVRSVMDGRDYIWGHHRYIDFDQHDLREIASFPPDRGRSREQWIGAHTWQSCYAGMFVAKRSTLLEMSGFDMQFSMRHAGEDQQLGYRLMKRIGATRVMIHEPPFAWHPAGPRIWPEQVTNLCDYRGEQHDIYHVAEGVERCRKCPFLYYEETTLDLELPFDPDRVRWTE
jgi:hypothetical protein